MKKTDSVGKCHYCEKPYSKRSISRHLETHLKALPPVDRKKSFHLRVEAGPYFLQLMVDGDARLEDVDRFLRQIWLECCGHLSQFCLDRQWGEEEKMNQLVRRVFSPGQKLWYAYDFGSTTELDIKVLSVHPVATKENILLLSRNEPFETKCEKCKKKPAAQLCTVHWGEEEGFFCDSCAEKHEEECEEAEYAMVDVVNSPRMGACAYDGGSIDLERDVFSK